MANWIKANGEETEVFPADGRKFTLEELQKYVGGYIELVPGTGTVYCNEEGRQKELPYNGRASEYFSQPLVGDVIECLKSEIS